LACRRKAGIVGAKRALCKAGGRKVGLRRSCCVQKLACEELVGVKGGLWKNEFVEKRVRVKAGWLQSGFLQEVLGVKNFLCTSCGWCKTWFV
jgi:hypothetical protein